MILAERESAAFGFEGLAEALVPPAGAEVDVRLFGKPTTRPYRRMGVALAAGHDTDVARDRAKLAAGLVQPVVVDQ